MTPVRVGFNMIGGQNWAGGYNYLLNLVKAVTRLRPDAITPVMCFGEDTAASDTAPFECIEGVVVFRDSAFDEGRKSTSILKALLFGKDHARQAAFDRAKVDIVFENAQFNGRKIAQPVIAWMPDFQHRLMPHLFSRGGYWRREIGFRAQVAAGRLIMLSSEDSRQACERFYPSSIGRTRVVHFTVPPPPLVARVEASKVAEKYHLPSRYIFLPNQFWKHKNHELVIDALALLKARGRTDLVIAASGRTVDLRLPEYFPALTAKVAALGLEAQFRILGVVPYEHVVPLMQASDALLNPSLFEGWSTTVEEARAAGVPMILSDLAVHREQAGDRARFFDPFDPVSLADALCETPNQKDIDNDQLLGEAGARMINFVDSFVGVVKAVAKN